MTRYSQNDPRSIQALFGSIAKRYDKANAVMSMQLHKRWNAELVRLVTSEQKPEVLLDLCCGTGDIAFHYLKSSNESRKTIMIDFCPQMIACAEEKAKALNFSRHAISYIIGDAQQIPLEDASVSCATVAYGIRNVKDPQKCMQEMFRVLQPGGVAGILELTRPANPVIRLGHRLYLKTMLPLLGKWMTQNKEAYQYLCNSIDRFIPPDTLENMLKSSGFQRTTRIPLALGIATILIGHKPQDATSS